jgi:hypothetical protein
VDTGEEKSTEEFAEGLRYGNNFGALEDLEGKKCPNLPTRS